MGIKKRVYAVFVEMTELRVVETEVITLFCGHLASHVWILCYKSLGAHKLIFYNKATYYLVKTVKGGLFRIC